MTRNYCALLLGAVTVCGSAGAQSTAPVKTADIRTSQQIRSQAADLLVEARKKPDGSAGVTLEKYPNHFTMLTVRVKPGGVEMHRTAADIFIVQEGEATIRTGGTIVDPTEKTPGEVRGAKLEGANEQVVHVGDVVHIAPGVPHQTVVAPGKTFTYYVIKVIQPEAK